MPTRLKRGAAPSVSRLMRASDFTAAGAKGQLPTKTTANFAVTVRASKSVIVRSARSRGRSGETLDTPPSSPPPSSSKTREREETRILRTRRVFHDSMAFDLQRHSADWPRKTFKSFFKAFRPKKSVLSLRVRGLGRMEEFIAETIRCNTDESAPSSMPDDRPPGHAACKACSLRILDTCDHAVNPLSDYNQEHESEHVLISCSEEFNKFTHTRTHTELVKGTIPTKGSSTTVQVRRRYVFYFSGVHRSKI